MRSFLPNFLLAVFASLLLGACSDNNFADLEAFVEEKKARPGGIIAPIPTFKAYEAFSYSAASQRSPFDRPIEVREIAQLQAISAIKPDETRAKEFLEQYTFDSLSMVGLLVRGDTDWTLIRDPEGGVHGKIVETTDTYIAVIEIVSDGSADGWVERPRTIKLNGI